MNSKNKSKIYIITASFGLVALFLLLFFVFPSLNKIKSNSDNLLLIKKNVAILKAQAVEVENFKNSYDNYKSNIEKIENLFIDFKNPVNFIEFLEKAASDSQIKSEVSLFYYSLNEEDNTVTFQTFSSGEFLKILNFVKTLENGPYLIEIENLTIKNLENESVSKTGKVLSEKIEASFIIKAFNKFQ